PALRRLLVELGLILVLVVVVLVFVVVGSQGRQVYAGKRARTQAASSGSRWYGRPPTLTKSRERGSMASRASTGYHRLWRSIRSLTSPKSQRSATACQPGARSAYASSRRSRCASISASISRRRRMYGSGPPSEAR